MLSISCRECGHDNEFMNLVEASAVIGMHPESLRRLNRFGDITSLNIERKTSRTIISLTALSIKTSLSM